MKVGVLLPTRGECKSGFAYDLAKLTAHTLKSPDTDLAFVQGSGTLIHDLRNDLAQRALDLECDWLFWLDDDMRFPPDALERLLSHRRDIVAGNYITRKMPLRPVAKRIAGNDYLGVPTTPTCRGLEEVDAVGFGCALIHSRVFQKLEKPWFSMPFSPAHGCHVGEDVYFCVKAGLEGHPTFIDHDVSKRLQHVGDMAFTWDHYDAIQELDSGDPRSD